MTKDKISVWKCPACDNLNTDVKVGVKYCDMCGCIMNLCIYKKYVFSRHHTDYKKKYHQLLEFIERLGMDHLGDWDKVCDCPYGDGLTRSEHDKNCLTVNIRKDLERFGL